MDPDATYARMTDDTVSLAGRTDCALALLVWFARGGFLPRTQSGQDVDPREQATILVAQAVDSWAQEGAHLSGPDYS